MRVFLTWFAVLILAGGCTCCCGDIIPPLGPSPDLSRNDIVGTWRSDGGAQATFRADGTVTVDGLDKCYVSVRVTDTREAAWFLHEGSFMSPAQKLELVWTAPKHGTDDWLADSDHVFFGPIGDPDGMDYCYFKKI